MVLDKRVAKRCRFLYKRRLQIFASERHPGLSQCRLESTEVQNTKGSAGLADDAAI
jgi:hypothetical protein